MNTETTFRIIIPALIVAFVAHRGYYVRKHGKEENTLKKREEGTVTWFAGILGVIGFISALVVCWLNNARNSLPGLAERGRVGHLPKMGDEPCVVESPKNFS